MDQIKIDRINALTKKHREEGLTPEETAERYALRQQYIASFRKNLTHHLENTCVIDEETGEKRKLRKKA